MKMAHSHGHGHDHSHATSSRKRLIGALAVTALVFVGELVAAYISGSLSLAADAGHMAVDSSGLVIALLAAHLSLRPRDNAYTWGWARSEVIAAALQAGSDYLVIGRPVTRAEKPAVALADIITSIKTGA